ncbi:MAG: phosphate acetyltransferase [Anaerococcus sp.]|uniref:phosphate acetyltransferase n=1 Tax=Anaerococcus sp. TaxID=1872515 RepID=UPI00261A2715|nr:phosphate acetyltransferase [Anaerococcus sp.]MCI5972812.1 phosphate acetyltransferase [Anaerococcus sp.]MDD6918975.1 phosphate acetyltransferase [Peptoniphilaceae bacterium]MDY2927500.1 phosphate acetyltransferase [Anaerococcus sp.]
MPEGILENARKTIEGKNLKIVLPEGSDPRVLAAALRHKEEGLLTPIVLGDQGEIQKTADKEGLKLGDLQIINPQYFEDFDKLVDVFVEVRRGKTSKEEAEFLLKTNVNYFGVLLVKAGYADGMVSGAVGTTGDTIRPALQIIRTKPGVNRASGVMVMIGPDGNQLVFADTAVNITLESDELAEVAVETAKSAESFGMDPYVALLSFSTHGSAHHDLATKVAKAKQRALELNPDLKVEGEIQFDAAIDPNTAAKKAPGSEVAGKCNVFIFPDLQAGNIGYKIAQRLGGYKALGPILQGLNAPVNDLSRGCSEQDVYEIAIITASQAVN